MTHELLSANIHVETLERFHHEHGWKWYYRFTGWPEDAAHLNQWVGPCESKDTAHLRGTCALIEYIAAWRGGRYR